MSDHLRPSFDEDIDAVGDTTAGRRFRRALLGYRRNVVDDAVTSLELRVADLEQQALDLREELLARGDAADEVEHDLVRARAELRYWNDRAAFVDSEVTRARGRAADLEAVARDRADTIEADAQERALQIVDRACAEASSMLEAAREEAREMFLRFEVDVDLQQQRLERAQQVRGDIARSMQAALVQFEGAVAQIGAAGPIGRIETDADEPVRRTSRPTFGTERALAAAARFEAIADANIAAALTSPLPPRTHPADEAFAELTS